MADRALAHAAMAQICLVILDPAPEPAATALAAARNEEPALLLLDHCQNMSLLTICPRMSDPLGFLLTDVARLLRRRFDERVRALGVTRPQWRVLVTLSRNEGANQGSLADLLEVEPITLCRMIDRLEEAELVERRRDPADRRAWQIFLTPSALPLIEQLRAHADAVMNHALAGADEAEQAQLAATLERLRANLLLPFESDQAAHG